jgi:hypothetical protein
MSHTITAEPSQHRTTHPVGLVAGIVALVAAVIVTVALAVAAWNTGDDVQQNEDRTQVSVERYQDCRPPGPC